MTLRLHRKVIEDTVETVMTRQVVHDPRGHPDVGGAGHCRAV